MKKIMTLQRCAATETPVEDARPPHDRQPVSSHLTVAVATVLPNVKGANISLQEFPAVRRWRDRLMELPAWQNPFGGLCGGAA